MVAMRPWMCLLALAIVLCACDKPKQPEVSVLGGKVTSVTPQGVVLRVELDVTNPNSFPIEVQSVSGKLFIHDTTELGTGSLKSGASIGARRKKRVAADLTLGWTNMTALASSAAQSKPVPFTFKGKAVLGTESVNLEVPFEVKGELTQAQLINAGLGGLPKIPALGL
jgi:LEA14-like dessication related protein